MTFRWTLSKSVLGCRHQSWQKLIKYFTFQEVLETINRRRKFLKVHLPSVNCPPWVEQRDNVFFYPSVYAVVEPEDPEVTEIFYFKKYMPSSSVPWEFCHVISSFYLMGHLRKRVDSFICSICLKNVLQAFWSSGSHQDLRPPVLYLLLLPHLLLNFIFYFLTFLLLGC